MRILRWVALVIGLGALAALIIGNGADQLVTVLARGGYKLLLVPLFMIIPFAVDAKGWQALLHEPPPWRRFIYARWVGEAVNSLLPVAQVGGLFIKAYLLSKRDIEPSRALASALVSATVSAGSLLLFMAATLSITAVYGPRLGILLALVLGAGLFGLAVYFFYRLQRRKVAILPARLRAWAYKFTVFSGSGQNAAALGIHLDRIYRNKKLLFQSFLLQLFGWLLGTFEVWLIVHLLGGNISVLDAMILEGLGQTVRHVAFFIPGALGLQEGVYLLVGTALGLSPRLALSVSLVKRFREMTLGVPGLIVWQINEGWSLLRHHKT